jgi:hypothetical protein
MSLTSDHMCICPVFIHCQKCHRIYEDVCEIPPQWPFQHVSFCASNMDINVKLSEVINIKTYLTLIRSTIISFKLCILLLHFFYSHTMYINKQLIIPSHNFITYLITSSFNLHGSSSGKNNHKTYKTSSVDTWGFIVFMIVFTWWRPARVETCCNKINNKVVCLYYQLFVNYNNTTGCLKSRHSIYILLLTTIISILLPQFFHHATSLNSISHSHLQVLVLPLPYIIWRNCFLLLVLNVHWIVPHLFWNL